MEGQAAETQQSPAEGVGPQEKELASMTENVQADHTEAEKRAEVNKRTSAAAKTAQRALKKEQHLQADLGDLS